MRINKLSIDSSEVVIEGEIFNLGYSDSNIGKKQSSNILGKIFK